MESSGLGHNGGNPPLGDATPALMYELLERHEGIVERRKAVNKAGKEFRAEVEKNGIPIEAWDYFLKNREKAGTLRERTDAAYRELMRWDRKPVGLQASMDLTASQGSPELNAHELERIDEQGFEAGKAGKKRESSPYTPGTEAAQRFDEAWLRGQAEAVSKMGEQGNGAAEPKKRGRPKGSTNRPKTGAGATA